MDLSVIILSYNTKRLLLDCLNSLFRQTENVNFEVLVVDNGSVDGSVEAVKKIKINKKIENLKIIENRKNLGFAAGNNVGIKKASGDFILLLNSDTVLKENAFKKLVDFARQNPKIGVVGPRLLNQDGTSQPSTAPFFTLLRVFVWLFTSDRWLYSSPLEAKSVDWIMGSAFLVKREVVNQVGLLDENFFMYIEEQEWCYRIKKAGWQIWFCPKGKIYHLIRGSSPEGRQKVILWIYQGLIYFYQKHFAPWRVVVLKLALRTKAIIVQAIGFLTNNSYLKETYAQAFKAVG